MRTPAVRRRSANAAALAAAVFLLAFTRPVDTRQSGEPFDLVLAGGRVMDPASGLDAVRHVGVRGGRIAAVSPTPLAGAVTVDVAGLVVAPGFIDPHAHAQTLDGNRFQARDGVTTALELESGAMPIDDWYRSRDGAAILNYGATIGHIYSRIAVMHERRTWEDIRATRQSTADPKPDWAYRKASAAEMDAMIARLDQGLADGALGIGMGPAYTPAASRDELLRVFELAARRRALAFIHMRSAGTVEPGGSLDALQEVLANVAATGASVHIVHIGSNGLGQTPRLLQMIDGARARGLDVSTEVYPYTAASTYIQSALFEPGWQERFAIGFGDVQWAATGERLTAETFARYRQQGGLVVIHMIPDEAVRAAIAHPQVLIGSDGVPLTNGGGHPRGVGTYARVLGRYVRQERVLDLMTALGKISYHVARRLEPFVPAMARKGRLAVGADADITVFDPARVIDRATYEKPAQYSEGIRHVIVNGTFVVRDEQLIADARPGRAIRNGDRGSGIRDQGDRGSGVRDQRDQRDQREQGDQGPGDALREAIRWYTGVAGTVDDVKAKARLTEAAATGEPLARMWVARCHSRGRMGFAPDRGTAESMAASVIDAIRQLAAADVLEAVFLMGTAHDEALGVSEDPAEAASWFRRAAERGHVLAQHNLGNAYAAGRGLPRDEALAVAWWLKAAAQGDAIPQLRLGEAYEHGRGVAPDLATARRWYSAAADRGNAAAAAALRRLGGRH